MKEAQKSKSDLRQKDEDWRALDMLGLDRRTNIVIPWAPDGANNTHPDSARGDDNLISWGTHATSWKISFDHKHFKLRQELKVFQSRSVPQSPFLYTSESHQSIHSLSFLSTLYHIIHQENFIYWRSLKHFVLFNTTRFFMSFPFI